MTYFGFLVLFLIPPILLFAFLAWRDGRQGRLISGFRNGWPVPAAIGIHMLTAMIYTTPWDNYLVATGVWTYNPALVTGRVIGYVPVEEYTFFILETLLAGLVWWALARRIPPPAPFTPSRSLRVWSAMGAALLWLAAIVVLAGANKHATYLALTLAWALPPIILQFSFGADILWHRRRLFGAPVVLLTVYLSLANSLAIGSGTWTIARTASTGSFLGALPMEEAVFFLLTNVLIAAGMSLLLANTSRARWEQILGRMRRRRQLRSHRLPATVSGNPTGEDVFGGAAEDG